jgi:hypothetical protein
VAVATLPQQRTASVHVLGDSIHITDLELVDRDGAGFLERVDRDPVEVVRHALKIGLTALEQTEVSLDIEFVRREFERLMAKNEDVNRKAEEEVRTILRSSLGAGGELPKTLDTYLGAHGTLAKMTSDLFDERLTTSVIGKLRLELARYFGGDTSVLATLLNPSVEASPLHQFADEMRAAFKEVGEQLAAVEAARVGRAEERAKGTAKGFDFEEAVHLHLADLTHGCNDLLDRTGETPGLIPDCKKGDWVITLDPAVTGGAPIKVVVEAKNRYVSRPAMVTELAEAKENRAAAVALAVFHPDHAPTGVAPLQLVGSDVYCVLDPNEPDAIGLEAGLRLARAWALAKGRGERAGVNTVAIATCVEDIQHQLAELKAARTKLNQIGTITAAVGDSLDGLRTAIERRLTQIEVELQADQSAVPA